jgi:hypothetical protein
MRAILAIVALVAAPAVQAVPITLDFSSLSPGDVVTTQFAGVTFSLIGGAPIAGPLVVDPGSSQTAGSGGNLITPTNNVSPVCCVEPFFDIRMAFANPIDFFSILALDAEAGETYTLSAFLSGVLVAPIYSTAIIGDFSIPTSGGPIRQNVLGQIGSSLLFDEVVIDLSSSGPEVWDDVTYNPASSVVSVPEPGTLALLSIGLAGLALTRRRGFAS